MNKERRKKLAEVETALSKAADDLDDVAGDEEAAKDSLPESLQNGEQGEQMTTNVETLNEVRDLVKEAKEKIDEAVAKLGDVG